MKLASVPSTYPEGQIFTVIARQGIERARTNPGGNSAPGKPVVFSKRTQAA
ncbi:hypothetical protein [Halothiobacillus diazotrophicus]|uniref:hypothetical protein n=1 Tax=Halothiobacillus diazotrophicus TaxID=1860122 RepID=UPI0012E9463D|nr:hypothetical protein [Halothiobacillus diazotrophicus]